ncbi:MAG: hypothetical protein Q8P01_05465 [bacterium]|nr:hypothetical protein [bacterium]
MKNNGSAKIVVIILALAVVLGVGYGVWRRQASVPVVPAEGEKAFSKNEIGGVAASDETAGWKLYRSEQNGFEFKYPADFRMDEQGGAMDVNNNHYVVIYKGPRVDYGLGDETLGSNFLLTILPIYTATVREWEDLFLTQAQTITFGGNQFQFLSKYKQSVFFLRKPSGGYLFIQHNPEVDTGIPEFQDHPDYLDFGQQKKILDGILTTFKFIK